MNANEIFEMTLNELTVEQFVVVMFTICKLLPTQCNTIVRTSELQQHKE